MSKRPLREAVGAALNATSLAPDNTRETPIDRVAALSRASRLGSALWRLKYGDDVTLLTTAAELLANKARTDSRVRELTPYTRVGRRPELLLLICQYLIGEWLQDNCNTCGGRGRTGLGRGGIRGIGKLCLSCKGSGKRRINGAERGRALGVTGAAYWKTWHPCFEAIWTLILEADTGAASRLRAALRRE